MKSNASGVYRCAYLPCMHYSDSCYNVKKHMSRCQFRGQYERQQETVFKEVKGEAVPENQMRIAGRETAQGTLWRLRMMIVQQWIVVWKERMGFQTFVCPLLR